MTRGMVVIVGIVALVIGFGVGFILRPIMAPAGQTVVAASPDRPAEKAEPRGTQYFAAHLDEARQIVAQCRDGSVRGDECANADAAVQEADGRERFKKFTGD
ncbi:hypothetical protein DFR49_3226 [Hephaestia caeni]|jgi:hypothetical protein|uniref:Conjugative transfer region protein TrbK n=1 Tax=Hephaestia caeni TaxID=645617 RepID=A0A397NNZ5_9SPHN|nr:hypothetical protein [Hephaestia caeni]RIA37343.1 hypothetical protein DFR49_3226 [Hephaestia caeni]